jgi:hypothetical protein
MAFGASPVVFNFDASGVLDGEDPAASLQVRWDFDDDGAWDTVYSTTKAASWDYAQDYAVNVANETYNGLVYQVTTVNGYAQSFTAVGTGIGRVALRLVRKNEAGTGTVTVGIKSTLTGPFLSSVSMSQSQLADTWNLFDLPDLAVTNGGSYYLVLLASDANMLWAVTNPGGYAGGQTHYTTNGGASWVDVPTFDHVFRVYDATRSTVPLTKSKVWRVRMEVKDGTGQAAQAVRDVVTNSYDNPPSVSLGSVPMAGVTAGTMFNLTANGSDPDGAQPWDGMLQYRWDVEGDGNFEFQFGGTPTYATTATRSYMYGRSGIYQARVEVRDRYHATASAAVAISVAPVLTGISLPASTCSQSVLVTLTASGLPEEVLLSEDAGFAGAVWQAYRPAVFFQLSSGAGSKTVHAKTRSGAGNESASASATVALAGSGCPVVTTLAATDVILGGATFNGAVNPNGSAASGFFQYGVTTAYGSQSAPQPLGSGVTAAPLATAVTGLLCSATYHYRAAASNAAGVSYGSDVTFTTPTCPVLAISNAPPVAEGNSSTTNATFTVSLSPAAGTVSVSYATANGTALSGSDYVAASGTITFLQSATTQTGSIAVAVKGDGLREPNETFLLELTNPVNAALGVAQAVGTIQNDDVASPPGDLEGDGKSDILWRKTAAGVDKGAMFLWTMSGTGLVGARYLAPISEDWQVQFTGDFNGDSNADVLWRNFGAGADAGKLYIWMMNGPNVIGGTGYTASQADLGWRVDGVGDLNGDGRGDIVWRKTGAGVDKGAVFLWTMDGTGLTGARYLDPISEDWQVVDLGDFNGDGKADILWRNVNTTSPEAGKLYIWLMDGPNLIGGTGYTAAQADLGWRVDGVGDLNGDGKDDIVWRKIGPGVDQGAVFLWTMNGTGLAGARYLDPISEDWQVQGVGDFNGDGKLDILWRNQGPGPDIGKLYIWMMDGPSVVGGTGYTASQADLGWRVDSPKR